ncbi:MAG: carboxypeptidase-like regulatory domain-containing protein, partial [Planctomycetota bacterium]
MRTAWLVLLASLAFAQEPDDPVAFTLGGRVLDRHAKPLAGLRVEAWDRMAPERYLGQTVSGATGRFLLAVRASAVARREFAYAPIILVVRGPGMAEARLEARAGARDVEVRTEPALVIRGVVRDQAGGAVPAAVVRARSVAGQGPSTPLDVIEETTTDEEGRFELRRFAARQLLVEADADGNRAFDAAHSGQVNEIRLPKVARVRGRLVDANADAPVAGARLLRSGRPVGETDAEGRFSFPEPLNQEKTVVGVTFWKEGYDAGEVDVVVAEPRDYRLTRVAPLRGRVVDQRGQPISAARVVIEKASIVAWSDATGAFELAILPLGIGRLRAAKSGYVDAAVRMELGLAPDTVTLQLSRGARVSGRVSRGGPAFGARVAVHDERREIARAFTDKEGRFLLRGVPALGKSIVASEARRRSMHLALEDLAEDALVGPLALELKDHLPWGGIVRSDAGHPLKDAVVRCGERRVTTDEGGRFLFENLPVRSYRLHVEAPKHRPVESQGYPGRALALVAESRFGDRSIAVRVDGEGSGEVRVALQRRWPPRVRRFAVSDLPGRLVFEGLLPGDYDLTVTADGHLDDTRVVVVAGVDVEVPVTLARGGS